MGHRLLPALLPSFNKYCEEPGKPPGGDLTHHTCPESGDYMKERSLSIGRGSP